MQLAAAADAAGSEGRVGANLLVPFLDLDVFDAAASGASVVELFSAVPDRANLPDTPNRASSSRRSQPRACPQA